MKLPIFQIDAFTNRFYGGNPAAVIVLERWLPDDVLQAVAAENNLAETALVIAHEDPALLRWFTPTVEAAMSCSLTVPLAVAVVALRRTVVST